jgi:inosine/guanosine/xanthosine phosphorylase family protein
MGGDDGKATGVAEAAAQVSRGVAALRAAHGGPFPRTALVLGSGFGPLADRVEAAIDIPYGDIPGFPVPTVQGHAGRLRLGRLAGTPVACLAGRFHVYEGHAPQAIAIPIRILRAMGVERIILTNASGGLDPDMAVGTLMVVKDHINFTGRNPLLGPNDDAVGLRFFDMTYAYDPALREMFAAASHDSGVAVREGVYVGVLGPSFETPAEIRMFRQWGGDAVGMSTVPECLAAIHSGMKVAALSLITNAGAGLTPVPLSHEDVMAQGALAYEWAEKLLLAFFARLKD